MQFGERLQIFCLNTNCNVRYTVDADLNFVADEMAIDCLNCRMHIYLPESKLVDGAYVKCPSCQAEHLMKQWQHSLVCPEKNSYG